MRPCASSDTHGPPKISSVLCALQNALAEGSMMETDDVIPVHCFLPPVRVSRFVWN
jgi:hypothetical protein